VRLTCVSDVELSAIGKDSETLVLEETVQTSALLLSRVRLPCQFDPLILGFTNVWKDCDWRTAQFAGGCALETAARIAATVGASVATAVGVGLPGG
jgi:hypothetical protein